MTFSILDHLEKLTPADTKGRYICPVCEGSNFTIDGKSGAFKCWLGCESKAIREAIAPLPQRTAKPPFKAPRTASERSWVYQDVEGENLIKVCRKDEEGKGKRIWQMFWDRGLWRKSGDVDQEVKTIAYANVAPLNWKKVKALAIEKGYLFLVEGEKAADALLKLGCPASTFVKNSRNEARFFDGLNLVLCPDLDAPGIKAMETIAAQYPTAQWAYAYPDSPAWQAPPKSSGVDFADWVAEGATVEQVEATIGPRRHAAPAEPKAKAQADHGSVQGSKDDRVKLARDYDAVIEVWGSSLRLNQLSMEIELNGKPIDLDEDRVELAIVHNVDISEANFRAVVFKLSRQNAYHPIHDYLNSVSAQHGDDTSILTGIAERYLGVSDPIYQTMVTRHLIAAVARVKEPGCKVDTMLILQGAQGIGKSQFFRDLAGAAWFDDTYGSSDNAKDEALKLHTAWFLEWSELESITRKKDVARLKAFIACAVDNLRKPYGRQNVKLSRPSVLVGTTNEDEILPDPTGDRRFWIIPVSTNKIPIALLKAERDRIWAAAMALYKQGEQWWMTELEGIAASSVAQGFHTSHPWEKPIFDYLDGRMDAYPSTDDVMISHILTQALRMPLDRQDKAAQMDVSRILRQSKEWERDKNLRTIRGERGRWWRRKNASEQPEQPEQPLKKGCSLDETSSQQDFQPLLNNLNNLNEVNNKKSLVSPPATDTPLGIERGSWDSRVLGKKVVQVVQVVESPDTKGFHGEQPSEQPEQPSDLSGLRRHIPTGQPVSVIEHSDRGDGLVLVQWPDNSQTWVCDSAIEAAA